MTPELEALLAVVSSFATGAAASWLFGRSDERRLRRIIEYQQDEIAYGASVNDELIARLRRSRRNEWEV